jgi:hypothetical protein
MPFLFHRGRALQGLADPVAPEQHVHRGGLEIVFHFDGDHLVIRETNRAENLRSLEELDALLFYDILTGAIDLSPADHAGETLADLVEIVAFLQRVELAVVPPETSRTERADQREQQGSEPGCHGASFPIVGRRGH